MPQKKKVKKTPVAKKQLVKKQLQSAVSLDTMLECIDTYFLNHNAEDFYDILTALRGPDTNDTRFNDLKIPITTVIRYAVCKKSRGHFRGMIQNDTQEKADARVAIYKELAYSHGHFLEHAQKAFTALGLSWDKVNDINPGRKGYVLCQKTN